MAGGVTGLYEGLVGLGVTGALFLVGFVGLVTCLDTGFTVLALAALENVDFDGLTLDNVGFEGAGLAEFTLGIVGLDGVAFDGVTFGLGEVFFEVVGCGFFGTAPWSDREESDFVLGGLVLAIVGTVGFFLLSDAIDFLGLL